MLNKKDLQEQSCEESYSKEASSDESYTGEVLIKNAGSDGESNSETPQNEDSIGTSGKMSAKIQNKFVFSALFVDLIKEKVQKLINISLSRRISGGFHSPHCNDVQKMRAFIKAEYTSREHLIASFNLLVYPGKHCKCIKSGRRLTLPWLKEHRARTRRIFKGVFEESEFI